MTFQDMTDAELHEAWVQYSELMSEAELMGEEESFAMWEEALCDVQMEKDRRAGL